MSFIVEAKNISKSFRYQKRGQKGEAGRNWFWPHYVTVDAVKSLDLSIRAGERVAFVDPNGAGKSTTIKMLSGILTPSSGDISVCGLNPVYERRKLSYRIGCVFGQRSQLLPNLPLRDSLELFGRMYDLSLAHIQQRIDHLTDVFALQEFINQPVRQLSLGQRMRGEIAASLMHSPQVIFLDEPTIGLDVIAKRELRKTLLALNEAENTTIFLTSHDTGDIESLTERMIVVDKGRIVIDEATKHLQKTWLSKKHIKLDYLSGFDVQAVQAMGFSVNNQSVHGTIDTSLQSINGVLQELLNVAEVEDIHLYDETLEDIIIDIYNSGARRNNHERDR